MGATELDSLRIVLDPVGQTGVSLALMLVMFSVALGLRIDDFRFLLDKPLLFAGGVAAQVLLLPLVTFLLILAIRPSPPRQTSLPPPTATIRGMTERRPAPATAQRRPRRRPA